MEALLQEIQMALDVKRALLPLKRVGGEKRVDLSLVSSLVGGCAFVTVKEKTCSAGSKVPKI